MQKFIIPKQMILLIGLLLPTVWCIATNIGIADGLSGIILIKESSTSDRQQHTR